jgi:hypothetical protein
VQRARTPRGNPFESLRAHCIKADGEREQWKQDRYVPQVSTRNLIPFLYLPLIGPFSCFAAQLSFRPGMFAASATDL